MVDLIGQLDSDDLAYIEEGLTMNLKLAQHGLISSPGLGVGQALQGLVRQGLIKKDMAQWAGILTAAGIDARMGGVNLPAMTLGGSGNQGIAASLPISAVQEFAVIEADEVLLKAVTLSYLLTCYIKSLVGPLSALCGSGVAAGAGAAAGVTYLLGGTVAEIGGAVRNHLENFATVVCDGAKTSCALKVGEAATSAVKSALLALHGVTVSPEDGFMAASPEKTINGGHGTQRVRLIVPKLHLGTTMNAKLTCPEKAFLSQAWEREYKTFPFRPFAFSPFRPSYTSPETRRW
jgi:L-cysteine desulfidase